MQSANAYGDAESFHWRVGLGHDTHRLTPGRPLVLGGVHVKHPLGLDGHSDADILLHAITDALLGAAGAGDIGEHFPDSDPAYRGIDSAKLLQLTVDRIRLEGWNVVNLDCTIHAQKPTLAEYKPAIKSRVAQLLGIRPESVNVKAKTAERVGPVGREEAMSADAIVLLAKVRIRTSEYPAGHSGNTPHNGPPPNASEASRTSSGS